MFRMLHYMAVPNSEASFSHYYLHGASKLRVTDCQCHKVLDRRPCLSSPTAKAVVDESGCKESTSVS